MKSESSIGIAILGGTGYGAGELLRLLTQHPKATVVNVVSGSSGDELIAGTHSHLRGINNQHFDAELDLARLTPFKDKIVFSALPHGASAEAITAALDKAQGMDIRVIDLSADFRLKDTTLHNVVYGHDGAGALRRDFVYGMPEIFRADIASARFIANPGCLATAAILAVAPIANDTRGTIVIDAKTGTSGAGKTPQPQFHHPARHASVAAYKMLEHRHEAEIRETLRVVHSSDVEVMFVPHLIPVSRGIFVTAYLELPERITRERLCQRYREFYRHAPFVRLVPASPELSDVVGSNFCDISVACRGRQVVVMSALDNLVKGMAGQAMQNMNLMCGLTETTGLWLPAPALI